MTFLAVVLVFIAIIELLILIVLRVLSDKVVSIKEQVDLLVKSKSIK